MKAASELARSWSISEAGQGGDVDFAGEQERLVLAHAGVVDDDVEAFIGEEALVLGDVDGDEGEVGLSPEAGHVAEGFGFIVAAAGGGEGGQDGGEAEQSESDRAHTRASAEAAVDCGPGTWGKTPIAATNRPKRERRRNTGDSYGPDRLPEPPPWGCHGDSDRRAA